MPPLRETPRWTARQAAAAAFVVTYAAVQIVVPLVALASPHAARFGWQMYSRPLELPAAWVVLRDGSRRSVPDREWLGERRPEVRYEIYLPDHLCRTVPGAAAALVRPAGGGRAVRHPCP